VRGEGAGTVIVGRALHEMASGMQRVRPAVRETSIALLVLVAASVAALFMLHAFLTPG